MILFKACPRCSGDLNVESDMYGPYVECFQCGHMADYEEQPVSATTAIGGDEPGKTTTAAA